MINATFANPKNVSVNADKQSLNERLVYINHDDHLRINITSDRKYYTKRDSASVLLLSSDLKGHIEDPGYYFLVVTTTDVCQHLDNLLLSLCVLKKAPLI